MKPTPNVCPYCKTMPVVSIDTCVDGYVIVKCGSSDCRIHPRFGFKIADSCGTNAAIQRTVRYWNKNS